MNIDKLIDYIKQNDYSVKGINNNFKCQILASRSDFRSAILKANNIKYDIYCIKPWAYCPLGKIEINIVY